MWAIYNLHIFSFAIFVKFWELRFWFNFQILFSNTFLNIFQVSQNWIFCQKITIFLSKKTFFFNYFNLYQKFTQTWKWHSKMSKITLLILNIGIYIVYKACAGMIHYILGTYVTQLHKPIRKTEKRNRYYNYWSVARFVNWRPNGPQLSDRKRA